jgi:hypothetical protein
VAVDDPREGLRLEPEAELLREGPRAARGEQEVQEDPDRPRAVGRREGEDEVWRVEEPLLLLREDRDAAVDPGRPARNAFSVRERLLQQPIARQVEHREVARVDVLVARDRGRHGEQREQNEEQQNEGARAHPRTGMPATSRASSEPMLASGTLASTAPSSTARLGIP